MAGKKAKVKARKAEEAKTANAMPETQAHAALKPSVLSKTKPKPGQAGDVFDVFMLKEVPGKGLGAFATCPIKFGAKVFTETPLVIIEKRPDDINEDDVVEAYKKLTIPQKRVFDAMRNCHEGRGCYCKMGRFFSSIFNLEHCWRRTGCFPICARFNHSCRPNIAAGSVKAEDRITFTAITDIAEGEELCFSYCVDVQYMTYAERRAFLQKEDRCFDCICEVCTLPSEKRLISDMRRCIMRHLCYWIEGQDLYEAPPAIETPDPRRPPEIIPTQDTSPTQDISPTTEVSYEYLLIRLAEVEGIRAGAMIPQSYMTIIAQNCAEAYFKRETQLPRGLVKQMKQWLEIGHKLGRIHDGPRYRHDSYFARPKDFLDCIEDDGSIRWDSFMAAKSLRKC